MTSTLTSPIASTPSDSTPASTFRLTGRWFWAGQAAWVLMFLFCIFIWATGSYEWYDGQRRPCNDPANKDWDAQYCEPYHQAIANLGLTDNSFAAYTASLYFVAGVPYFILSFIFARRRPDSAQVLLFAILLAVIGAMGKWMNALPFWATTFIDSSLIDLMWAAQLMIFCWVSLGLLLFYTFPDGKFSPSWMKWVWIGFLPFQFLNNFFYTTPLAFDHWPEPLPQVITLGILATLLYSMFYRYTWVANPEQRQQIKWLFVGLALIVIIYMADYSVFRIYPWATNGQMLIGIGMPSALWELLQGTVWAVAEILLAVCIAFSVFRYRLWDVDVIINRALVYGALSLFVVLLYVALVGILGSFIQARGNLIVSIIATGLIAVTVQPIRERLQRGVNRLMYGERDDPITVLARLGHRLETTLAPNAVLPAVVETVAQTLKLPYAAILWANGEVAAEYGKPNGEQVQLPLTYQGEIIGQLAVSPRAIGEAFGPLDLHLLQNIAHQAGAALHAVSLTIELQNARRRLVNALEEERRRLRRDLHDGLGPTLASQGLKLAASQQLIPIDPDLASVLLAQVITQNKATVDDIRRLVYGLRPPALDERGLVEAIRDHVSQSEAAATQVEVSELPDDFTHLPAAVEVAAYRIVLEALTNIIRHAQAKHCTVRFSNEQLTNALKVEISDDGIGFSSSARRGVGLHSMRERAEELGGTLQVESGPRGTGVVALLPIT
jgi:signal transduction histidine kinase